MIEELMKVYNNCSLNDGKPECTFAEKIVFNEGWLLRSVLNRWRGWKERQSTFEFMPFPNDVKIYSEGELYTSFKGISGVKGDYAEKNTHVDGIVGNFFIAEDTKSGIRLDTDFKYLAVFEAKMYSPLSKKTTNARNYSQVSRNIACIINSVIKTKRCNDHKIHFIVTYPTDSKIKPEKYTKEFVEGEIDGRLIKYEQKVSANQDDKKYEEFFQFKTQWNDLLKDIQMHFITWEDILSEFEEQDNINEFYKLCKRFSR